MNVDSPSPLWGPRLRIRFTRQKLEGLDAVAQRLKQEQAKHIVQDFDPNTGQGSIYVEEVIAPDPVWGVIIGEVAHNLRAALDNLVYSLVLANGCKPTKKTQFPIFARRTTSMKSRKGKGDLIAHFLRDGVNQLNGVDPNLVSRFDSFQPYAGGKGFRNDSLWVLHQLNNADKHRTIQTAVWFIDSGDFIITKMKNLGIIVPPRPRPSCPLKAKARLYEFRLAVCDRSIQPDFQYTLHLTTEIVFGKQGRHNPLAHMPVIPTLNRITGRVSAIIESFSGDI